MTPAALRDLVVALPSPPAPVHGDAVGHAIDEAVAYLGSDAALETIVADPYWPKWDGPWWQALALWEVGEGSQIPGATMKALLERVDLLPLHEFPTALTSLPPHIDWYRDSMCHCGLGSLMQMAAATGLSVPAALPWTASWFPRYQMSDGGLTCDSDAYTVTDEVPSSMVATVPALEAMLAGNVATWTDEHRRFVDDAVAFLVGRRLVEGSSSKLNAEERAVAPSWLLPTFPRFYFYDVLRGLAALVRAITITRSPIPLVAIAPVVEHLVRRFPDGVVRVERRAFAKCTTRTRDAAGAWIAKQPARTFSLLEATSELGAPSRALTLQWTSTRAALAAAIDAGLVH